MPTESAFVAPVLPGQGPAHGRLWRRADLWLGIVLSLLAVTPVLVARYPQMSDYPAHLARYYVMLAGGHNDVLNRYYDFRWQWTGNVGVDLLIRPFAALFGLELGG
ncbi:MAG TPA: hypothetical protein VN222_17745, partial [Novosphingobium sp.]|nr:hypothetical protein [Novosphingobium sp.]